MRTSKTREKGRRWGHHHWGDGDPTPEEARDHVDRWVGHVLDHVGVTDAQRAEIDLIIDDVPPEMLTFRREGRALKKQGRELIVAEPIDRAGLERVRTEGIDLANKASARGLEVFIDIYQVLTPRHRPRTSIFLARFEFRRAGFCGSTLLDQVYAGTMRCRMSHLAAPSSLGSW